MTNRECNLECVKGVNEDDEIVEFVGPVRIILVDQPKHSYKNKVCYAAIIVLAQMAIAITCSIVIFYSLSYKRKSFMKALHIFFCTMGLHLLLPTGVLTMNSLNGAAAPMTLPDRKFEHGISQTFGLGTAVLGAVAAYYAGYPTFFTIHSLLGIIAILLGLLGAVVGILIFFKMIPNDRLRKHKYLLAHQILGVLTIAISSTCLLSGITDDSFIDWLPLEEILYCLCLFCIFYTCVVIYKPFIFIKGN